MTNRELELKPCPFCGSTPHFDHDDAGYHWIECGNCRAQSGAHKHDHRDAREILAEAWNRRPEPAQAEPVAWMHFKHGLRGITVSASRAKELADMGIEVTPLYAAPQQEQK